MSQQLNPAQVAAWQAAMNAYLQGNGPLPNWSNYFNNSQTQNLSQYGNTSVNNNSPGSTPGKINDALNDAENANQKVIADQIKANLGDNTEQAAAATKKTDTTSTPSTVRPVDTIESFGEIAKPISETTPGVETPQSKNLNLGQQALSGHETITPILKEGSTVTPKETQIEIQTPVKVTSTVQPSPTKSSMSVDDYLKTPEGKDALLNYAKTNSENNLINFDNKLIDYHNNLVEKNIDNVKQANQLITQENINISANNAIDKLANGNPSTGPQKSTNPELESAILTERTQHPEEFAGIKNDYILGLEKSGVITPNDVTILNKSVTDYNAKVEQANKGFQSTNPELRASILSTYANNPGLNLKYGGNYLLGLEKQGVLSFEDISAIQPNTTGKSIPTGFKTNPVGELAKGITEGVNDLYNTGKYVIDYIGSGGKAQPPTSKGDIISRTLTAPISQTVNEKGQVTTTLSEQNAQNNLSKLLSDIQKNPAREIGRTLPTIELSLLPIGEATGLIKTGVTSASGLFKGETLTSKEIIDNILQSKEVKQVSTLAQVKNPEALQASVKTETGKTPLPYVGIDISTTTTKATAPYVIEKTSIPGVSRFFVGSGNDFVELGKGGFDIPKEVTNYDINTKLIKPEVENLPPAKPAYVAAGIIDTNKGTVTLFTPETEISKVIPTKIIGTGKLSEQELGAIHAEPINNKSFEFVTKQNDALLSKDLSQSDTSLIPNPKQVIDESKVELPESEYVHPTTLQRVNDAISSGFVKPTGTGLQFKLDLFNKYPDLFREFIISGPSEKLILPSSTGEVKLVSVGSFGAGASRGVNYGSALDTDSISIGGKQFDQFLRERGLNPGYEEPRSTPGETLDDILSKNEQSGSSGTKTIQKQIKEITESTSKGETKNILEPPKPFSTIPTEQTTTKTEGQREEKLSHIQSQKDSKLYRSLSKMSRMKNITPGELTTLKEAQNTRANSKQSSIMGTIPKNMFEQITDLEEVGKQKTKNIFDFQPLGKIKLDKISDVLVTRLPGQGLDTIPKEELTKYKPGPTFEIPKLKPIQITNSVLLEKLDLLNPPDLIPKIPLEDVPKLPDEFGGGGSEFTFLKWKPFGDLNTGRNGSSKKGSKVHVYYDVTKIGNVRYSENELNANPFRKQKKSKKSKRK